MDKLLPCPFCGGEAIHDTITMVCCKICFATAPASKWNTRHTPEGWQLVPVEITAETGHKSGMMGDFSETVRLMCEACDGDGKNEYEADGACNECDGAGEYGLMVPVSWTTIKAIHRRIAEIAAAPKWGGE